MEKIQYTHEQAAEAGQFIAAIESVPKENRSLVMLMTEAFINGMKAQEQISSTAGA